MDSALVPVGDEPKERPLKVATRNDLPNRKPPWWSSQEHGIPMGYIQKPPPATATQPKMLTADGEKTGHEEYGRRAPGVPDLEKLRAKEMALIAEERSVKASRIDEIERKLREEVARHTPYHEKKATILVRAFQTFDHDQRGTLPLDAFRRTLECFQVPVTEVEARALFRRYGQDAQRRLPYQVFTRALFTSKSRLLAWTHIARGSPFVSDANVGQKAADRRFDAKIQPNRAGGGHGVTGVYPPTRWATDSYEAEGTVHPMVRARCPPDCELELEHVYGYAGKTKYMNNRVDPLSSTVSPNLFYTSTKEVVYFTAAVGVVLGWEEDEAQGMLTSTRQRFFQAHDDDILCLAIDESKNYCATGQTLPLRRRKGQSNDPIASIWDVHSMQELMQLPHRALPGENGHPDPKQSMGGVQAVAFSEDGQMLITVCRNLKSTVHVWMWRKAELLYREDAKQGVPPQVYGVRWNPVEPEGRAKLFDFATYGVKHISFWKEDTSPKEDATGSGESWKRTWSQEAGAFMKKQDPKAGAGADGIEVQDVLCVEFLMNGNVVTGMASGDMYVWKPGGGGSGGGGKVNAQMQADRRVLMPGSDPSKPRVRAHLHSLQVLQLRAERTGKGNEASWVLLSGGGGGKVKVWRDLDGEVPIFKHEIELPRDPGARAKAGAAQQPPAVKAIDCFPGDDDFVVGTDKCDVYKIRLTSKGGGSYTDTSTLLVKGHRDDLHGVDAHPTLEGIFASACESDKVYIWDATAKSLVGAASLKGGRATAVHFRADAKHLAVGTAEGRVYVFREVNDWSGESLRLTKVSEMGTWPIRDCISKISEVRYSPDMRTLAVASHDQYIDLYDASDSRYMRLARCKGHSSSVCHLDWSVDSKLLQSQCNSYELLYWNVDRGDAPSGWAVGQPSPFPDMRKQRLYGRQVTDEQRDTEWATWTCNFGFDVLGIWPPGYDNTDINMVCRSPPLKSDPNRRYIAAADDRGGVLVFNYPTVVARQPFHWQHGHSSHVSNVRWLTYTDDDGNEQLRLISAGGHDRALFQWKVKQLAPPRADDPAFRGSGAQFNLAKRSFYYRATAVEWNGEDASYRRAERAFVPPEEALSRQKKLEGPKGEAGGGTSGGAGGGASGGAGGGAGGGALEAKQQEIERQKARIEAQQKEIEELKRKLGGKGG